MEVDEIQRRITYQDEDDEDGERVGVGGSGGAGGGGGGGEESESGRLRAWHTSRIFRVSRASGGKDRHSKVLTAKGLRDRRVRLSVSTAIQFYDLQDRLGYDQPSKAVEWLIKAAADSISELPSLNSRFPHPPDTPRTQQQLSDDTSAEAEREREQERERERHGFELEDTYHQHHQMITNAKSSSTSETSKGSSSVLSLSRSEIRVKARERARERAAKDKQKEDDESPHGHQHHQLGPHAHQHNSQNSSFTELLTGGVCANNHNSSPANASRHFPSSSTSMDYFTSAGLFGSRNQFSSGGFSGQATHFGMAPPFSIAGGGGSGGGDHHTQQQQQQPHHPELQHFAFLPENFIQQEAAGGGSDYNLNFSISSGLAAYNRGTLQSNSPSSPLPSHLQRFSSQADHGSNIPFFMGNAATAGAASASPPSTEAHQQHQHFQAAFDGRLHLCYGDADRHSDLKGKRKT